MFGMVIGLQCALTFPRTAEIQTPASWNNYHLLEAAEAAFRQYNRETTGCEGAEKSCPETQSHSWWHGSHVTLRDSTDGVLEINDYKHPVAAGYSARVERLDDRGRVRLSVYGNMPYCQQADSETEMYNILKLFKRTTRVSGTGDMAAFIPNSIIIRMFE